MMRQRAYLLLAGLVAASVIACNLPLAVRPAAGEVPVTRPPPTQSPPSPPPTAVPLPSAPSAPTALNVPLRVANPTDNARPNEPITSGIPLPREMNITDPASLRLVDAAGDPIPAQFTPLARWGGAPDASAAPLRWVLADFQVTIPPAGTNFVFLQQGGPGPAPAHAITLSDSPDALTVDTGAAQFAISRIDGSLNAPGLAAPLFGQAHAGGVAYTTTGPVTVSVEMEGPMRVSVHVKGSYRNVDGLALLDFTSRYWFYAGQPTVRLFHTVENNTPCPLVEYGQPDCYDIGLGGSVQFSDLSLVVPSSLGPGLTYRIGGQGDPASGDLDADLVLYQDSSGTNFWDLYATFNDWDGRSLDTAPRMQSAVSFQGYRTTLGEAQVDSGSQAAGWLSLTGESGAWTVAVRDFWQNFPKALRARPDGTLEVGLFPVEFGPDGYAFSLRAGEHKTHEVVLGPFAWERNNTLPLVAAAPPEWYVSSGALALTALPDWSTWPDHEQYLVYLLDTAPYHDSQGIIERPPGGSLQPNLLASIEAADFYGIFDYGDWPIDYEGYEVTPLNAKYDNNTGMWLQWARGVDPRWFGLAEAANRHAADIDILHNLHEPRHWADGIAFGHSWHDEDGFTNPHRNGGGNHPDTAFGTQGMLLTTYLTGYEKTAESALELADCIEYRVRNDEHLCGVFPGCNAEGYALGEGLYDAGSRPAANALAILVAAYRATADPRYLEAADALVGWASPASQPYLDGPTGQDMQVRPWMLNMYLRALADYIELREEFGLEDPHDARGAYLAYADWLRTYAWIDLEATDTGLRAAYPYEWWFDDRQGDPNDEWSVGNNVPSINNWLLLGADTMAYAYHLSGDPGYLERAATLFRTGSRDPWYPGDANAYAESKEAANSISYGHLFLYIWAQP